MYKLYKICLRLNQIISTIICGRLFKLSKVSLGKNCRFWGIAQVVKFPGSHIAIGSNCRFRSSQKSNLIGINHACMISTHSGNAKINIGQSCGFSGTVIASLSEITIGSNTLFGANTLITDFDWHNVDPAKRHDEITSGRPIYIGNNVFIGYGSTILKGSSIGDNSVIGANSVVTTAIPPNCIAAGNPCKVVKLLNTNDSK